jgi:uncharacterized protein (TIGR01244 family)
MSLEKMAQLAPELWTCGQIDAADFTEIANKGFRTVINARPDHEAPDQPISDVLAAAAEKAGLRYEYLPVVPNQIREQDIEAFAQYLDVLPKPVLTFCRTGNRVAQLWTLTKAHAAR